MKLTRALPLLVLLLLAPLSAQDDETRLEIYPVDDLFEAPVPPSGCRLSRELDGEEEPPLDPARLVGLVRARVSAWPEGTAIEEHRDQLLIRHTPAAHTRVQDLLSELRRSTAVYVTLQLRAFARDDADLRDLGVELVDGAALLDPVGPDDLERIAELEEPTFLVCPAEHWLCLGRATGAALEDAAHGPHGRVSLSEDRRYVTLWLRDDGPERSVTVEDGGSLVLAVDDTRCLWIRLRIQLLGD